MPSIDLDIAMARKIVLTAQGFGEKLVPKVNASRLGRVIADLGLVQIDSVNVLVRSHYLPLFSRLGRYELTDLDSLVYATSGRQLFEYWGHEASLIPLSLQPLFRWRMARAQAGKGLWAGPARFAKEQPQFVARALAELRDRGPLSASELTEGGKSKGAWWGWSDGKRAMEYLFWTGAVTTTQRRTSFERVYDLTERVLPPTVINAATPDEADAQRQLVLIAARAMGIASARDLRDYFRFDLVDANARILELVESRDLTPVTVEGWKGPAYMPRANAPAKAIEASMLLSPFDNLIWERDRTMRLFGTRVRLEIYTPAHKRTHGYYVLPFLLNERIAARVDLKADRKAGMLQVQSAHLEPGHHGADVAPPLARNLAEMAGWLGLVGVKVVGASAFAKALRQALRRV